MSKCIIMNGTSSSGKTTIIKELQLLMPELAHIQIDSIAKLYFNFFADTYEHTAEWGEKRYKRQVAIREILTYSAQMLLKQGFDVCLDIVLDGPYANEHMNYYLDSLKNFNPTFIGLNCDLTIVEERERLREDRPIGLARSQLEEGIHENRPYTFVIDNTKNSANQSAKTIFDKMT